MATKKQAAQGKEPEAGDVLTKAAKAVGSTLGAIAKKTGIAHNDAPAAPTKKKAGRLVKKTKVRLPRREKKQAKKAAAKTSTAARP